MPEPGILGTESSQLGERVCQGAVNLGKPILKAIRPARQGADPGVTVPKVETVLQIRGEGAGQRCQGQDQTYGSFGHSQTPFGGGTVEHVTRWVLLVNVAVLIAYDFLAYYLGGVEATISRVVLRAAIRSPFWAFMGGFLCGHLFAPQTIDTIRKLLSKE
jgi:hypothetical protein